MRRQSTVTTQKASTANFNISFSYTNKDGEVDEMLHEDIATPKEFLSQYNDMCELSNKIAHDPFKTFKPAPYTIKVTGTLNGNDKFTKTFTSLDLYHNFLQTHKLLPDPSYRPPVTF